MSITDLDVSSVWMSLSLINKSFLLFFCGVSLYTFSLAIYALFVLHSVENHPASETKSRARLPLDILLHRFANLRQLHVLALYLFGFCIAMQVPGAFHTLVNSKDFPFNEIIGTLTFVFYCDATVFLGFLVRHTVQWIVSARIESFASRQG